MKTLNMSTYPRMAGEIESRRARVSSTRIGHSALNRSLTLAATSLGYVVVQLDVTIVNVALNAIGVSLGGTVANLQWIVNAYTITFASFILTAGALGDRIGAKRVFVLGSCFSSSVRSPARWRRLWLSFSPLVCVRASVLRSWCRIRFPS